MRRCVLSLVCFAMACGPSEPAQSPKPTTIAASDRFVSKQGRFSVAFPEEPKETTKPVPTELGMIVIHEIGVTILEPGRLGAYTVSYADIPFADHPDLMVEVARKGVKEPPRKLLTERKVVLGYVDGWEMIFEDDALEKTMRVFQVGTRFYQVTVEYPKTARPSNTETFLDSFRID